MNMDAYTGVLTPLELAYAQSVADKAMINEIHSMLAAKMIAEARNGQSNAVQERPAVSRGGVAAASEVKIACQCADDAPETTKKPSAIAVADVARLPRKPDAGGSLDAAKKMLRAVIERHYDTDEPMEFKDVIRYAEGIGVPGGSARRYFTLLVKNGFLAKDPDDETGRMWNAITDTGRP